MEKKRKIKKLIIGIVIFISVLIFIQFKKKYELSKNEYAQSEIITKLPEFSSLDINGNFVKSNDFKGKNLYVQFVNPIDFDDIDLIKKVYSDWKDENIILLTITKDVDKFKFKSGIDLTDIIVISNGYSELKSKFNSPVQQGTYYLFNASGKTVRTGRNSIKYKRGIKTLLNQVVKNKYFSISNYIRAKENIKNIEWFSQVAEIVEKENKDFFIIAMFTSICDTCPEGSIIRILKRIYAESQSSNYVMCILSQSFSDKDIDNLKSQLNIDFPIFIADQQLNQKWKSLIQEFSKYELSNIVFIMDGSGKILKILNRGCNCQKSFFKYIFSLTKI